MAAVSAAVNASRSKSSCTIGVASTARPIVAGTLSISISDSPSATVVRIAADSLAATCRDTAGMIAVAIDTPNRPIGRYIRRNA